MVLWGGGNEYDSIDFITNAIYENQINTQRCNIELLESCYIHEGVGDALKTFFTKIKEAISKLIHKVIDFFKRIFGKATSNNKQYIAKNKIKAGLTDEEIKKALDDIDTNNNATWFSVKHNSQYYMDLVLILIKYCEKVADNMLDVAASTFKDIIGSYSVEDVYTAAFKDMKSNGVFNNAGINPASLDDITVDFVFNENVEKVDLPTFSKDDKDNIFNYDNLNKTTTTAIQKLRELDTHMTKKFDQLEKSVSNDVKNALSKSKYKNYSSAIKFSSNYVSCTCRTCTTIIVGVAKIAKVQADQSANLVILASAKKNDKPK